MDKKCPYLGCLWGAWMVSVGCLDGLGVIWDTSMGDKIVILNEKVQSLSYNSHTTFSPSAHFLAKIGQKWRIFRPLLRGVKRHFWSKSTYSPGFIHKTAPKNAWERSTLNQSPPYLNMVIVWTWWKFLSLRSTQIFTFPKVAKFSHITIWQKNLRILKN